MFYHIVTCDFVQSISITICDPILENGAYCGSYDFVLEHTKDEKVTLCRNSFYCINMFYIEIPFV